MWIIEIFVCCCFRGEIKLNVSEWNPSENQLCSGVCLWNNGLIVLKVCSSLIVGGEGEEINS